MVYCCMQIEYKASKIPVTRCFDSTPSQLRQLKLPTCAPSQPLALSKPHGCTIQPDKGNKNLKKWRNLPWISLAGHHSDGI